MKLKVCLFAGTTEGRVLAGHLSGKCDATACVATEYGDELLDGVTGINVRCGRLDEAEMKRFFDENRFDIILDATHPFAQEVTRNIKSAAEKAGIRLIRVLREEDAAVDRAVYVKDIAAARDYLMNTQGNILITTGSKELKLYTGLDMERAWARVLPLASSLEACAEAGVPVSHIIAAQGPFGEEINYAQLKAINACYMVTKESGKTGGFPEKISAAQRARAVPVIIGRPHEDEGVSCAEAMRIIDKLTGEKARRVYIIGAGPGDEAYRTHEATEAIRHADAVIGAKSVTECINTSAPVFFEYLPDKVSALLESHGEIKTAAVVMRGDTGFYSGAKKLTDALEGFEVSIIPGISAPVYLAAKLGVSWDDARFISLHGREGNIAVYASRYKKLFVLTGGENTVQSIAARLCRYGLGEIKLTVGENLGLADERIFTSAAFETAQIEFSKLATLYIENASAEERIRCGIPDDEFIRRETPMTKAEVRALSVAKLAIKADSVVYDIGSGTGSVSVECALNAYDGRVYAIEKNEEAVELTQLNSEKFSCDNIEAVSGTAPEVLIGLPMPTHAFIGGSSGNLESIVSALLDKNPFVRIVINTVTLETLSEASALLNRFDISETVSVNIARSRRTGRYNLMTAQNPVYIITLQNAEETADAR